MASAILGPNGKPYEKSGQAASVSTANVGFTGINRFGGFVREEYLDKLVGPRKVDVYQRMRNDGTVAAMLRALSLPVIAASWVVEPASKSANAVRAADLVKRNLFERLNTCWEETVRNLLTCLTFGFSCSAKNWRLDRGEVLLSELRPLHPRTLLQSCRKGGNWDFGPNGELRGVYQAGHDGEFGWREDYLKRSEFVHLAIDSEFGDPEGRAIIRGAYKHYFYKDTLYRFWGIGGERAGVGTPVGKYPPATSPDLQRKFLDVVTGVATHERAGVVIQNDWEIVDYSPKVDTETLEKQIQHHDTKMAMSVLAQFLQLGTEGKGGAYALSSDQSDLFLLCLQYLADYVAAVVYHEVIMELVTYNIATDEFPRLSATIARRSAAALSAMLRPLVSGQNAPLTWSEADEAWLRERMELPERTEPRPARQEPKTPVVPPPGADPQQQPPAADPEDKPAKPAKEMRRRERIELRVFSTPEAFREEPAYPELATAIDDFHAAIVERSRALQAQVFKLAKLPVSTEAGFGAVIRRQVRRFSGEPFKLTPKQETAIDQAIASFMKDLVGKDESAEGFGGTASEDGILQNHERLAHAVGCGEARRLTDAEAIAFSSTRESPEIKALLGGAFDRLSENGRLRLHDQLGDIKTILTDGMIAGQSPLDVATELGDRFTGYETHEWERLARTECAFAANQGQVDEYAAEGVKRFSNLISATACAACQTMAGTSFLVSEAAPGENCGPFHPHCVCSTAPELE